MAPLQNQLYPAYGCNQETGLAQAAAMMCASQRHDDEQPTYDALSVIYNRGYEVIDDPQRTSAFLFN